VKSVEIFDPLYDHDKGAVHTLYDRDPGALEGTFDHGLKQNLLGIATARSSLNPSAA
jgi:hypothetical protein